MCGCGPFFVSELYASPKLSILGETMDTNEIVSQMQAEIARLSQAVAILTAGTPAIKRRGRPRKAENMPDWVTSNGAAAPAKAARKKRHFSPAQRKAQSEKMRQYWQAKKKTAAKKAPANKTAKKAAASA